MIEARIIEYIKSNDYFFRHITIPNARIFLQEKLNIKTKTTTRKKEIIDILKENLQESTLTLYYDLKGFQLLRLDIVNIFETTIRRIGSLEKKGVLNHRDVYEPQGMELYLYDIKECIELYNNNEFTIRKVTKRESLALTDDNIAKSLYVINKSAKISRDTKYDAYMHYQYKTCKAAKTREINLYKLKDAVLSKLKKENKLSFIGIHKQIIGRNLIFLDLYEFSNYRFHMYHTGDINNSELVESNIEGKISSIRSKVDITFYQAIELLGSYVELKG